MEDLKQAGGFKTRLQPGRAGKDGERKVKLDLYKTLEEALHDITVCELALSKYKTEVAKLECDLQHHYTRKEKITTLINKGRAAKGIRPLGEKEAAV